MDWKNVSLHVSPKNCFLEPNLIQKPTKNQNCHPKKMCLVVFSYKNWTYWFLRACFEISAHTDVPNLFSILNCLLAMNRNPVIQLCNSQSCNDFILRWNIYTRLKVFSSGASITLLGMWQRDQFPMIYFYCTYSYSEVTFFVLELRQGRLYNCHMDVTVSYIVRAKNLKFERIFFLSVHPK